MHNEKKEKIDPIFQYLDRKFVKLLIKVEKNKNLTKEEKRECILTVLAINFTRNCVVFNEEQKFDLKMSMEMLSHLQETFSSYSEHYLLEIDKRLKEKSLKNVIKFPTLFKGNKE